MIFPSGTTGTPVASESKDPPPAATDKQFWLLLFFSIVIAAASIGAALAAAYLINDWKGTAARWAGLVMLAAGLLVALYAAGACAWLAWKVAASRLRRSR
jgi:hypothetical protein